MALARLGGMELGFALSRAFLRGTESLCSIFPDLIRKIIAKTFCFTLCKNAIFVLEMTSADDALRNGSMAKRMKPQGLLNIAKKAKFWMGVSAV